VDETFKMMYQKFFASSTATRIPPQSFVLWIFVSMQYKRWTQMLGTCSKKKLLMISWNTSLAMNHMKKYDEGLHSILPSEIWPRQQDWLTKFGTTFGEHHTANMEWFVSYGHRKHICAVQHTVYIDISIDARVARTSKDNLENLHNGQLDAIGHCQSDWLAHLLWGVYKCMKEYFHCWLSEQDLLEGTKLAKPFMIWTKK